MFMSRDVDRGPAGDHPAGSRDSKAAAAVIPVLGQLTGRRHSFRNEC
jgi:hypothetical protein